MSAFFQQFHSMLWKLSQIIKLQLQQLCSYSFLCIW